MTQELKHSLRPNSVTQKLSVIYEFSVTQQLSVTQELPRMYNTVQYSTIQYNTVQYNTNIIQYKPIILRKNHSLQRRGPTMDRKIEGGVGKHR